MSLRLITAPTTQPVTTAEAKAWARIDTADDDAVVDSLIAATTRHIERITGIGIMTQTWEQVLDSFPADGSILLTRGPVTAITSVKYYDADSVLQTIDPANYVLDAAADPQWLVRASSYSWPAVASGINNVEIRFTCAVAAADLADLKTAILMLVAFWYRDREAMGSIPDGVLALIANHRRFAL